MKSRKNYQRSKAPRSKGRGVESRGTRIKPGAHSRLPRFISGTVQLARRNRMVLRSCAIFVICLVLAIFAYSKFINEDYNALVVFTAKATGAILNIFDSSIRVNGTVVSSSDFSMRIVTLCTGIVPMILFISAVLAYPCRIKHKASGIVIGVAAIASLNLFRMVTIFYIGSFLPSFFDTAHLLIWQSLVILLAIVLWLFWAEKMAHGSSH